MLYLIIDGDSLVYRAACAVQERIYVKDRGLETEQSFPGMYKREILAKHPGADLTLIYKAEPVENALYIAKRLITKILDTCMDEEAGEIKYKIFLTSDQSTCFRYQVAKTQGYKANRKEDRPVHFDAVRQYMLDHWDASMVDPILEADDAVAIAATQDLGDDVPVIVGIDKDLDMIPGLHYNYVTNHKYHVSEVESYKNFFRQMLTGDSSDNIPGIPGIGPIKAEKILDFQAWAENEYDEIPEFTDNDIIQWMYETVIVEYINHYESEDDDDDDDMYNLALEKYEEMANLLWLIRSDEDLEEALAYISHAQAQTSKETP